MSQAMTHTDTHDGAMSDAAYQAHLDHLAHHPALGESNTQLTAAEAGGAQRVLLGLGAVGLGVTAVGAFVYPPAFALAAFEVGVMAVTAMSLGGLFFTMIHHITNAGWSTTIRRQAENLASMLPICMAMVAVILAIELFSGGVLLTWIGIDPAEDYLLNKKKGFLNPVALAIRFAIYFGFWTFLSMRLRGWSREQDRSGERHLSRRCRFMSGWGLLVFALSLAFFAFDFLMAMDFRFFSTMWGVYYFAGSAFSSLACLALLLLWLKSKGKLDQLVTAEHFHDHGKFMFGFTVFWGYISFGQYFLIWYSNIPEETMYFIARREGGWMLLGQILIAIHFLLPFFLLISRIPKKHPKALAAIAVLLVVAHVFDMIWIIKPMVTAGDEAPAALGPSSWWLDVAGVLGVFGVFGFFLLRRVASAPLVPMKDPRLHLAMEHRNYV
jgi:hypothetical protein